MAFSYPETSKKNVTLIYFICFSEHPTVKGYQ